MDDFLGPGRFVWVPRNVSVRQGLRPAKGRHDSKERSSKARNHSWVAFAHQRSEGLYEGAKLWPKLLSIESDCVPREERAIDKFLQAGNLRHV